MIKKYLLAGRLSTALRVLQTDRKTIAHCVGSNCCCVAKLSCCVLAVTCTHTTTLPRPWTCPTPAPALKKSSPRLSRLLCSPTAIIAVEFAIFSVYLFARYHAIICNTKMLLFRAVQKKQKTKVACAFRRILGSVSSAWLRMAKLCPRTD